MDDVKSRPGSPGNRSQAAAEKLCALREKANQALDEHRRRLGQIELELSERIKQLTEDFESTAANALLPDPARDQEIDALRRQIEEGQARHEKFVAQLTAAKKQLDEIQHRPCTSCEEAAAQLVDAQNEARQLRDKLAAAERQLEDDRAGKDKFAEQIAAARKAINELTAKSEQDAVQLRKEIEVALLAQGQAEERSVAIGHDFELLNVECEAAQGQLAELTAQLAKAQAETQRLKEAGAEFEGRLAEAVRDRDALSGERDALAGELDKRHRELQAAVADATSLKSTVSENAENNATSLAQAQKDAAELKERLAKAEATIEKRESALAAAAEESEKVKADLSAAEQNARQAAEERAAANVKLDELRGELEKVRAGKLADKARGVELDAMVVRLQAEVTELREATRPRTEFEALQEELSAARDEATSLASQIGQLQHELTGRPKAEDAQELVAVRAERDSLKRQLAEVEQAQSALAERQPDLDQLATSLNRAEGELAQLRSSTCPRTEFEELQRKFDLALADVQKLKRENSGLREELASRPAASDEESPELVSVRSDRDELAQRVAELEYAAATVSESTVHRDLEDLQRRFEMAVDDVRQLKQENAQLRQQATAAVPSQSSTSVGTGPQDWASQKAKLLAMLEEEDQDGPAGAARQKDRITIERTITATDRALEQKNQELEQLRAMLESQGTSDAAAAAVDRANQHAEVLDADEIIASERQRLSALQAEWEAKVRTAELEFAVERAKLAREQAALKEQLFELQMAQPKVAEGEDGGKPRRRWLSALGLGEENDDAAKKK